MDARALGVPIYTENGLDFVLLDDLKLALDKDAYQRILDRVTVEMEQEGYKTDRVTVDWLAAQY